MELRPARQRLRITVSTPAAWFLLPLSDPAIHDPDLDDSEPRYRRRLRWGWAAVEESIMEVHAKAQAQLDDPLIPEAVVDLEARLGRDQARIIYGWFSGEVPAIGVDGERLISGRHRTWGLQSAGFDFAPVLLAPFDTAIQVWDANPKYFSPLDTEDMAYQRSGLDQWQTADATSPWREANPELGTRWRSVLNGWQARLEGPTT